MPATPVLPVASVSISTASANEGNSGTNTRTVTVTLSAPAPGGGASVDWGTAGTGVNPAAASDFQGGVFPSGTISISVGNTSGTGTITITGDTVSEGDETFRVTISNPTGCTIGVSTVDGTIADDDATAPAFDSVDADGYTATQASGLSATIIEAPFAVTRNGFAADGTATTYLDTIQVNRRKRQLFPNAGTLTADKVTLSEVIYVGDTIAGGKTNNSTRVSPKPFGKWTIIPQTVVGTSLRVASAWAHKDARNGQQVRAVRYTLSVGGVDKADVYVSTPTLSSNTGWARQVEEYSHTFDISNNTDFPDPSVIKVRVRVYPWLGRAADGSVFDSDDVSSYWLTRSIYFKKMVSRAANPTIAVVNRLTGDNATAVVSTNPVTARANPFLTATGALQALQTALGSIEGSEIWFATDVTAAQTLVGLGLPGADIACDGFAVRYRRDPDVATVTIDSLGGNVRLGPTPASGLDSQHVIIEGIRFGPGTGSPAGIRRAQTAVGVPLDVTIVDCETAPGFNLSALRATGGDPARTLTFWGGTYQRVTGAFLASSLGNTRLLGVTATSLNKSTTWFVELNCNIGCEISGFVRNTGLSSRNWSRETLIYFSRYLDAGQTSAFLWSVGNQSSADDNVGIAMINSVLELNQTNGRAMRWSGDAETSIIKHIVIHNVSTVGPPGINAGWNILYDDVSPSRGIHRDISIKNAIGGSMPTKGDNFGTGDATRTGNEEYAYGVGQKYIYSTDETLFDKLYMGVDSELVPAGQTGINNERDPLWTNQQVWIGGAVGPGGGTYTLQVGSPLRGISDYRVTRYSIEGTEWASSGNALGAHI